MKKSKNILFIIICLLISNFNYSYAVSNNNPSKLFKQANVFYKQKNYGKAIELYEKAANQGNEAAQFLLGSIYYKGEGASKDYSKAKEWFEKAANQGNGAAQFLLGSIYYKGEGVTKDYSKAKEWLEKVANQGHPKAQFIVGTMYYLGEEVIKDYNKAAELLKKSCNKSHIQEACKFYNEELFPKGY